MEFSCPLCEYNLRGLTIPRCPECGFEFRWGELIDGKRTQHPYLFEHQRRRNLWSFWKTYWRDCRPSRFWSELNPAQPVRLGRLLLYWFLANLLALATILPTIVQVGYRIYERNAQQRAFFLAAPPVQFSPFAPRGMQIRRSFVPPPLLAIDQLYPVKPWTRPFLRQVASRLQGGSAFDAFAPGIMLLAWPWFTMATLMIFQGSMRRAKINKAHVLRTAIYCCDFGFMILILALMDKLWQERTGSLLVIAGVCTGITVFRLNVAYSHYLRFHLPLHTVLASQLIVFLIAFIALLQTGLLRSML
jgi:phage shock protein PspC (stress-responsive transcriptional regulator)